MPSTSGNGSTHGRKPSRGPLALRDPEDNDDDDEGEEVEGEDVGEGVEEEDDDSSGSDSDEDQADGEEEDDSSGSDSGEDQGDGEGDNDDDASDSSLLPIAKSTLARLSKAKRTFAPRQTASFQVISLTPQLGPLEGWMRQERLTANGRKYTMFVSPSNGLYDSKRTALQSIGAVVAVRPPKPTSLDPTPPGKKRKRGRIVCAVDEQGDTKERQPRRSYIGPPVPSFGRMPAGDDLEGWTVERAVAVDGTSYLLYRDPTGKAIGSRGSALAMTNQLEIPRTHLQIARDIVIDRGEHESLLDQQLLLPPSTAAGFATRPDRTWAEGSYPKLLEAHFGAEARAAYDKGTASPSRSIVGRRVVVIDLFCGVGGLSMGLRAAGFPNVLGVDTENGCISAYDANKCGKSSVTRHIHSSDTDRWVAAIEAAGCAGPNAKAELILVAAPPCQPYSAAGLQGGASDDRGDGLLAIVEIAIRTKPLAVLIENVPNMMDSAYSEWVQPVLKRLQDGGYSVRPRVHTCSRHSVAQKRKRLLISALRTDRGFEPEQVLKVPASSSNATVHPPTTRDVIEDPSVWGGERPIEMRVSLNTLRARKRLNKTSSVTGLIAPDVTGLVSPYEPSPTVVTTALVHDTYFRLLAIPIDVSPENLKYSDARALKREHVLTLQSFPPDFVLHGQMRFQGMCIGNAVPPLFALDIGRGLATALDGCKGSSLLHTASIKDATACVERLVEECHIHLRSV